MDKERSIKKWQEVFYYFLLTAFVGYIYEYLLITFYYRMKFVNAGPFHLPLLLIYGVGGTFIIMLLKNFRAKKIRLLKINVTPLLVTVVILLLVCAVEYFGHYAVETISGVKPWDYSEKFMNLNGRICLEDSMRFVFLGLFGIYVLVPAAENLFGKMTKRQNAILCGVLAAAVCIDVIIWIVQRYS